MIPQHSNEAAPSCRKLAAARTRLVLERPFLGSLVMHLALKAVEAPWCPTFATDGRGFFFRPSFVDTLDFQETQFILAHEALHCAAGHFARRMHRTQRRWDAATDYAANMLLVDEGLKAPPGALLDARFAGMSAEEIYRLLPPDCVHATLDRHIADGCGGTQDRSASMNSQAAASEVRAGAPAFVTASDDWDDAGNERRSSGGVEASQPALLPAEREQLARVWQSRVALAEQHARQAGRLSSSCRRVAREAVNPRLSWRALLARYMCTFARNDYTYRRPSRRDGDALMPSLLGEAIDVVVALDTSGSLTDEDLAEFAAELNALKVELHGRVALLACDETLDERGPWQFEPWDPIRLPADLRGGGGTSFVPVFDWVDRERFRTDVLVYFTDGEGAFPPSAPEYPVLWVVKGRAAVPWGERIQLD